MPWFDKLTTGVEGAVRSEQPRRAHRFVLSLSKAAARTGSLTCEEAWSFNWP